MVVEDEADNRSLHNMDMEEGSGTGLLAETEPDDVAVADIGLQRVGTGNLNEAADLIEKTADSYVEKNGQGARLKVGLQK